MSFQSSMHFLGFYLNWKIHLHAMFADWAALPTWHTRGACVAMTRLVRGLLTWLLTV